MSPEEFKQLLTGIKECKASSAAYEKQLSLVGLSSEQYEILGRTLNQNPTLQTLTFNNLIVSYNALDFLLKMSPKVNVSKLALQVKDPYYLSSYSHEPKPEIPVAQIERIIRSFSLLSQLDFSEVKVDENTMFKLQSQLYTEKRYIDITYETSTLSRGLQIINEKHRSVFQARDWREAFRRQPTLISLKPDSSRAIMFGNAEFGEAAFETFFADLDPALFTQVRKIHIEACRIDSITFQKLLGKLLPTCSNLAELTITNCGLTDEMGRILVEHLLANQENCPSKLRLCNNTLTGSLVSSIESLLMTNKIVLLDISDNKIGVSELNMLSNALKQNRTLISFACLIKNIDTQGIKNFIELINSNKALLEIRLSPRQAYSGPLDYQTNRVIQEHAGPIAKLVDRNSKNMAFLFSYISTEKIGEMGKLFEVGVSMYSCDLKTGNSLLHTAAQQSKGKVVQYLLSRNFNRKLTNQAGQTARDIAASSPEIVALLDSLQIPPPPTAVAAAAATFSPAPATGKKTKKQEPPRQTNTLDSMFAPATRKQAAKEDAASDATLTPPDTKKAKLATPSPAHPGESPMANIPPPATIIPPSAAPMAVTVFPVTIEAPAQDSRQTQPLFNPEIAYFRALNGDATFFESVLPATFDVTKQYQEGRTLLHAAALYGHSKIITVLLSRQQQNIQAIVNSRDIHGRTPLHYACIAADRYPTYAAAEILLQNSANIDLQDMHGITPLYLLAGGFDAQSNCDVSSPNLKRLAQLLLRKASTSVNITIHDLEIDVGGFSLLHKAVFKGNYHLVSAILSHPARNLRLQDTKGNTVFHVAVLCQQTEIFARMLHEPEAEMVCKLVNAEGKNVGMAIEDLRCSKASSSSARTRLLIDKIYSLYGEFSKQSYPDPVSGVRWMNPFNLFYGARRAEKVCAISLDDLHSSLAQSIASARGAGATGTNGGNKVAMALSLVVSTLPHTAANYAADNKRALISIKFDDGSYRHVFNQWQREERSGGRTRSPDMEERLRQRLLNLPAGFTLLEDIQDTQKLRTTALSSMAVDKLYQQSATIRPNFEELFHHSEQAVLEFLESDEGIEQIITKLKAEANFVPGCKVYAVILNLYSPYYVCKNCEAAIIGEQNTQQSVFLVKLRSALQREGRIVSRDGNLHMVTCVSSKIPITQNGDSKRLLADHNQLQIDLRVEQSRLLLQKDIESTTPQPTVFSSRK